MIWGSVWPSAPYGGGPGTSLETLVTGAPGLVFDQEYGLIPHAPVFILAATGFWGMWREGGAARRCAGEVALIVAALLGAVGAFALWWGGSAAPGRPIVSGLPLLALPIAWAYARGRARPARALAHRILLWVTVGMTGMLALAQQGLLLSNSRDGSSALLTYLSPLSPITEMLPTFIGDPVLVGLAVVALWVVVIAAACGLTRRVGRAAPATRRAWIGGPLLGIASLATLSLTVPVVRGRTPKPERRAGRAVPDRNARSF